MIYDGDCDFCRRQIRLLERWDPRGVILRVPFQKADLERLGVSRAAAEETMHLIAPDGEVRRGAEAARRITRLVGRPRLLAWLFALPGAMFVAERLYRWVAKRRHRFGCGSGVCARGVTE